MRSLVVLLFFRTYATFSPIILASLEMVSRWTSRIAFVFPVVEVDRVRNGLFLIVNLSRRMDSSQHYEHNTYIVCQFCMYSNHHSMLYSL